MITLLLFSNLVFGDIVCDVTLDGRHLGTYTAKTCDKSKFTDERGDPESIHSSLDYEKRMQHQADIRAKFEEIKSRCPTATGVQKSICDYLILGD